MLHLFPSYGCTVLGEPSPPFLEVSEAYFSTPGRSPLMIWVCRATVEWYWQGKPRDWTHCHVVHHKSKHELTRACAVRGWRLTAWALARPALDMGLEWRREALWCSELSSEMYCRVKWLHGQYIPEDNSEHHTRRRENLKSHIEAFARSR
jgi:hypothetical protein